MRPCLSLFQKSNCFSSRIRRTIAVASALVLRILIFPSHHTRRFSASRQVLRCETSSAYVFRVCPMCVGHTLIYTYLQGAKHLCIQRVNGNGWTVTGEDNFLVHCQTCTAVKVLRKFESFHPTFKLKWKSFLQQNCSCSAMSSDFKMRNMFLLNSRWWKHMRHKSREGRHKIYHKQANACVSVHR